MYPRRCTIFMKKMTFAVLGGIVNMADYAADYKARTGDEVLTMAVIRTQESSLWKMWPPWW